MGDRSLRECVLEAYNAIVDLVDLEDEKQKKDPFAVIEQAEIMHENEVSHDMSEHLCYLRGVADALDMTVIETVCHHLARRKGEG